jgi:hyperosmotically inducible periplasmic protein
MKLRHVLLMSVALGLGACGREGPPESDPRAQAPIDEARQAEKAADAGKPLSDASLTQIVRAALESESSLDARKIDVENRNGNVTLHGAVATDEQREKAARIVSAVGGVRNVQNNLNVDASASTGATAGTGATIPQRKD